jgi:hypothetical protein
MMMRKDLKFFQKGGLSKELFPGSQTLEEIAKIMNDCPNPVRPWSISP